MYVEALRVLLHPIIQLKMRSVLWWHGIVLYNPKNVCILGFFEKIFLWHHITFLIVPTLHYFHIDQTTVIGKGERQIVGFEPFLGKCI